MAVQCRRPYLVPLRASAAGVHIAQRGLRSRASYCGSCGVSSPRHHHAQKAGLSATPTWHAPPTGHRGSFDAACVHGCTSCSCAVVHSRNAAGGAWQCQKSWARRGWIWGEEGPPPRPADELALRRACSLVRQAQKLTVLILVLLMVPPLGAETGTSCAGTCAATTQRAVLRFSPRSLAASAVVSSDREHSSRPQASAKASRAARRPSLQLVVASWFAAPRPAQSKWRV